MKRRKMKNARKIIVIGATVVAVCIGIFFLQSSVGPVMEEVATVYSKNVASRIIESAVYETMEEVGNGYEDYVTLEKDENGKVQALKTDVIAVNTLKSRASLRILEKLEDEKAGSFEIPLGTLSGSTLLSGRGPDITVRLLPVGSVVSTAENSFSSAGINQTRHQIMLRIRVTVKAVLPNKTVETEVENCVCIAETVIVGDVPNIYGGLSSAKVNP